MRVNHRNVAYFASCNSHVDKEGPLQKFSEHKGTYQTKWFVLKGNILFYFDKQGDREPQGAIVLEGCRIELADTAEGLHAFQLSFSGEASKDYRLVAESPEFMESWMKALSCATYDYMKAVVDELQRQMDEISHHEGGDILMEEDDSQGDGEEANGAVRGGEFFVNDGAIGGLSHKSDAIVRATFPSDAGSTLKSAAFPNPLYDVLVEVPNTLVKRSSGETAKDEKTTVFIVERESSESDSEEEEEEQENSDTTSSGSQYANLEPSTAAYISTSLEDVSSSMNPMSFRSLSHHLTHSDTDLTAPHYTEKETLPASKSALQLPPDRSAGGGGGSVPPQKPPRFHELLYENVARINLRLSDIPTRASSKFFHRAKSSESLKAVEEGRRRSVFHVRDVRSFPEMHQEFGVLVIRKVNRFRQKKGQQ